MTYPSTPLGHYDPLANAKKRMKDSEDEKPEDVVKVHDPILI